MITVRPGSDDARPRGECFGGGVADKAAGANYPRAYPVCCV